VAREAELEGLRGVVREELLSRERRA